MNNTRHLNDNSQEEFDRKHWFAQKKGGTSNLREYEDINRDESDREHWFLGYWRQFIRIYQGLTKSQIETLVEYKRWSGALRDLIYELCALDALDNETVTYLLKELQDNEFVVAQLTMLQLLRDPEMNPTLKLDRSLELKADWATKRIIDSLDEDELTEALDIIGHSTRPKDKRGQFANMIRARLKTARLKSKTAH